MLILKTNCVFGCYMQKVKEMLSLVHPPLLRIY